MGTEFLLGMMKRVWVYIVVIVKMIRTFYHSKKSIVFLYTSSKQPENKTKKTIQFITASKNAQK